MIFLFFFVYLSTETKIRMQNHKKWAWKENDSL